MARIATKYVNWKIFIDGIEVPWIGFSVSVGMWNVGAASIVMEPDLPLQRGLSPTSLVHIFMYDDLEQDVSPPNVEWDKYKLWWEGEVSGYSMQKSGLSRQLSIDCMGVVSFLKKTSIYAHGVGGISTTHILTGSTLIPSSDAATQAVRKAIIPDELKKETTHKGITLKKLDPKGVVTLDFGERVLNVLAYLLSFNAVGRLNAVRRDLFGKINTITDQTVGRMIPRVVAQPYFEQTLAGLQGGKSLLDLVQTLSGSLYYDFVSTTGPTERKFDSEEEKDEARYHSIAGKDAKEKEQNIYSIPAFHFRNDYFFTPKIYYAIPPACNIVFPEYISNLNLSRTFFDDPTRLIVSTTVGADLSVVAPDHIFRYTDRKLDPAEFWANNVDGMRQDGKEESPYTRNDLNLFAAASDTEIERGIVCPIDSPDFEIFSAISNLFDLRRPEDQAKMQNLVKELGGLAKASAKFEERFASKERAYIYALKAVADYRFKLARFKRTVSIQMDGHRWLVPGLPLTILDTDQSYVALLTSHTFAVDAEANETSSVGLDFVRPFPQLNTGLVEKFDAEQKAIVENEKLLNDVTLAAEELNAEAASQGKDIMNGLSGISGDIHAQALRLSDVSFFDEGIIPEEVEAEARQIIKGKLTALRNSPQFKSLIHTATEIRTRIKNDPAFSKGSSAGVTVALDAIEKEMENPSADFEDILDQAVEGLTSTINDYYETSVHEATKATVELKPNVPQIYGAGTQSNKLSTSIKQTEFDDDFAEDFFAPPVFANMDLIDLKKSWEIYNKLVGSQPIADTAGNPELSNPSVAELKREAYNRYLDFADQMNKIFPVYAGTEKGSTEWGRKMGQSEAKTAESVRRWEEKNYLRREGLVSLKQFAKNHKLKIEIDTSVPPTVTMFLKMTPTTKEDTIFDKIVDEFTLQPRTVRVKSDASTGSTPKYLKKDKTITKLKQDIQKKSPDSMLFAVNRQALILNYSKTHFGSRSFDGR